MCSYKTHFVHVKNVRNPCVLSVRDRLEPLQEIIPLKRLIYAVLVSTVSQQASSLSAVNV